MLTVVKYSQQNTLKLADPELVQKRVQARLQSLSNRRLPFLVRLLRFGLTSNQKQWRLEFEKLPPSLPLNEAWPNLNNFERRFVINQTRLALALWRPCGFVHGDISPRNILVAPQASSVWFIDWVLDLDSNEGTPAFWNGELPRTAATDKQSLEQVFGWLDDHSQKQF